MKNLFLLVVALFSISAQAEGDFISKKQLELEPQLVEMRQKIRELDRKLNKEGVSQELSDKMLKEIKELEPKYAILKKQFERAALTGEQEVLATKVQGYVSENRLNSASQSSRLGCRYYCSTG